MRRRYSIAGGLALIVVTTVLFLGLVPFGSESVPPGKAPTVKARETAESETQGEVAGVHTARPASATKPTVQPSVKVVVSDGTKSRTIIHTPPAGNPSEQPQPTIPTEITINLRGPLEYRLAPGERSPILTYELTDGARHEWFPGLLAGWMDSPPDAKAPVWSTVLQPQASRPYIDDHVHFFIAAQDNAPAGTYKVSVKMVIRPGITLGVPVMVTVP